MAEKLQGFPPIRRTRKAHYPWDKWLNGDVWELRAGVDFPAGNPNAFRSAVYSAARRAGLRVRTGVTSAETLVVQAGEE